MFNIKRYDVEEQSSDKNTSSNATLSAQERLIKLNARLNKNKPHKELQEKEENKNKDKTQQQQQQQQQQQSSSKHLRYDNNDSIETNPYKQKRAREQEDQHHLKKHGKKWEKREKELKDSDLVPNDVRLAMKAEAEAAEALARGILQPINSVPEPTAASAPSLKSTQQQQQQDNKEDEEMEKKEEEDKDITSEGQKQEAEGGMDDVAMDAALADIESALVPLPTFEVKEITAEEKERAKSMGIPDWLAHPIKIEPETNTPIDAPMFRLSSRLIKQCKKAGITECFAVQTAVIPVLMRARHLGDIRKAPGDLCVSAPTGSGKTLAYVLPIIEILSQRVVTRLRALVVLPTRDLCVQVKETFETFVKGTDLKIATSTGQNSFAHEQNILVGETYARPNGPKVLGGHSRVDILITTPGRLIDHIKSTPNFTLQHLRFLVIDEADRLLNQSFQDWLYHILTAIHPSPERKLLGIDGSENIQLKRDQYGFPIHDAIAPAFLPSFFRLPESDVEDPKALSVQKLLFSATLTRNPAKIASLQLSDPQYVAVQEGGLDGDEKQKYTTPAGLTEYMIVCESSEKPLMVLHLLYNRNVRSALCFTKSVESAHRLCKLIQLYEKTRTAPVSSSSLSTIPKDNKVDSEIKERSKGDESQGDSEPDDGNNDDDDDSSSSSSEDSDSEDENESSDDDDEEEEEEDGSEKSDVEMEDVETTTKSTDPFDSSSEIEVDPSISTTTTTATATMSAPPIVVAEYSSDLPKSKRQSILRAFNKGEIHLLICSDLISRGMDLSPVSVVINYDVPVYMKKYIHRVGRTARAGKTGTAYSLVEMQEARHFKEMVSKAGHWEKIHRMKIKDQETKELVPAYTKALAGLKEALVSSRAASRKGIHRRARK
ncbi:ATP-dependent RNA helicase dbp6 [Lobosporangium transversale]|uniref:ATP-dependent RNA helicase n=1 Tax=Lobosporangium transversale TaxID=64571 RepID=A0A1Y2G7B7_9FUNG|nr:P-loop containing nucleoside triphosphate hydrolase protein [Lobosporangium transversale]KAF9914978.1 ATP-dependent RNA helicase dbp6 [Lobosporangium transversale]ORY99789.1 P-loop containing nucleoside triphosphate hydrolase protein [Lobosporangium transversale]|eukprot:XP_021876023.1 P-loop containing nucleoside triphosphate hydrolase protein [Lobosporangium transversale]